MKQKLTQSDIKQLLIYQQALLKLASEISNLIYTKSSYESQDVFVKNVASVVQSTAKVCDSIDVPYQLIESNF